ncbi:MAG: Dabb family protein [Clostridiales bacterium]|nr:Dabb family protein [Clostridiales bacterium]
MVKHIILWQLKDDFSETERNEILKNAKINLEGLLGKIEGLTEIKLQTEKLDSSNADMMLYSEFVSDNALKCYQTHPDHVFVADNFIRPFTKARLCLDFEE